MFVFRTPESLKVDKLLLPQFKAHNLSVYMVRADLIHPQISGNKWFKLKYNLLLAQQSDAQCILSFGGAYSNHIHALAYAAKQLGIRTQAVIRGEAVDNPTLSDARKWGMELHFVDRATFRMRDDSLWVQNKMDELGADFLIPEGGSNQLAVKGVAELARQIQDALPELDYLLCAVGTGGTLAGLISGVRSQMSLEGYPVLKNGGFLNADIESLVSENYYSAECNWSLDLNAHYGGYGKVNAEHKRIWLSLEEKTGLPLDPVYTSKLLRRFIERVELGYYPKGSTIALLHSGGVQGRRSLVSD